MYVGTVKLNRFFCDPMRSYNHYRSGSHMSSFQHFFNIAYVFLFFILLNASSPFASAQRSQDRAKQLHEDALVKLGGESFLKIQSIKRTGRA